MRPSWRALLLLPAGVALLAGLDAALLLLGVAAPVHAALLPDAHGALMVLGFVGTLIALERATALGRLVGYICPMLLVVGSLALLSGWVIPALAKGTLVAGMAAFTLLYVPLWRRQFDPTVLVQLLGAALGLAGSIVWLTQDSMPRVLPWLAGFVVLTIAAERVELARITMGAGAPMRLLVHAWTVVAALVIQAAYPDLGAALLGIALLAFVAWLLTGDIARRTIHTTGATRYMAACILAGYAWLVVAAATWLFGSVDSGPRYDAVIHAVFLGYVMSMIMAHASTILPAVLRIPLPYRPAFWAPAALLQVSLIVRLWLGDGLGDSTMWRIGGVLGVVALLLFVITAVSSAVIGAAPTTPRPPRSPRSPGSPRRSTSAVGIDSTDHADTAAATGSTVSAVTDAPA